MPPSRRRATRHPSFDGSLTFERRRPTEVCPNHNRATIPAMPDEHRIRRRAIVHGNVQGVFFRDSTRERANAHGVAGWVSNRADGAVEAVLEGAPDAVQQVLHFLES